MVERFVDGDPVNPAEEPSPGIEGVKLFEGVDEGILRRVGRRLAIGQKAERDGEQHPLVALDDGIEGTVIAIETSANERGVVSIFVDIHRRI